MYHKGSPWWDGVECKCHFCGGGFKLDRDDHLLDSKGERSREDPQGNTGQLGTMWSGSIECPYCKQNLRVIKFTK